MGVPAYIDDGNYADVLQVGSDQFKLPFFDRGDGKSFEIVRSYRVSAAKYKIPLSMERISTVHGFVYRVESSDPREIGNGILEYQDTLAVVPAKRLEATTLNFAFQFLRSQIGYSQGFGPDAGDVVAPDVWELPLTVAATVVYEYSLKPLPALLAPRVAVFNGLVVKYGGWGALPANAPFLGADSETELYKGTMYQRRSLYINQPEFIVK